MHINDSTLASTFDNAKKEHIEQTEPELLEEYRTICNSANVRHYFTEKFSSERLSKVYCGILQGLQKRV